MSGRPIVLAAGGTGGHVFPAQALASELIGRGREVVLMTDRRGEGYEAKFPGCAIMQIRAATPSGRSALGRVVALGEIAAGAIEACAALRRLRPALVIGFGGYPSLPAMLAARRLRLATAIHEQNAVLGRVNALLARRVDAIAASFPDTAKIDATMAARVTVTGNPVRAGIVAVRDVAYAPPVDDGPVRLVVLGGSQGARVLSDVVPQALSMLAPALKTRLRLVQQCRPEDLDRVRAAYAAAAIEADLAPFFQDMPALLSAAHFCITRAGASTVAELTVAGRPSLLVPYRHATDDHQTANARMIVAAGGALAMTEDDFTPERVADALAVQLGDGAGLSRMAAAARVAGRPRAVADLADLALRLADGADLRRAA